MKNQLFTILACLMALTFTTNLTAKHIIGGQMTYTCEGNDIYNITLTIYRDCEGDGAWFDDPAAIAVYHGTEQTPFSTLEVPINLAPIEVVPDIGNCINIPDGFCVEKGVYNFDVTLPASPESYHIVYQRCCRNTNIVNIINGGPGEEVGTTFSVEITPFAQSECNDSPVLNANPPIIFCAGIPFSFAHSAYDPDGSDEIVYELTAPLAGGGPDGGPVNPGGDHNSCSGLIPIPACPPPFAPVDFILPEYSPLSPLGAGSTLSIDPQTGTISGEAANIGQFIFAINIKEYRNGELISIVREDVQVLVGACDVDYVNYLEGFGVDINGVFEIELQGVPNTPLPFVLPPVPVDSFPFVQDYFWVVDLNNGFIDTLYPGDQVVILPGVGCYMGTLYVNHGLDCADELDLIIKVNDVTNVDNDLQSATQLNVYPNPFRNTTTIDYEYPPSLNTVNLSVYNALGQLIQTTPLKDQSGKIQIGETLSSGIYFVQINSEGQILKSFKVLKR